MEKEKSSVEITSIFPKTPEMIVIKGRQSEYMPLPSQSLYVDLKKFARVKEPAAFQLNLPLDSLWNRMVKRTCDVFLSTVIILGLLSWLMPIIALLIKLDSKGPVFFLQKRNKRDGNVFTCIKFRSMIENDDADHLPATEGDERITRFGRFLRNYFLYELPQFFNVLMGDMSFIGPRPHMINENNKYEEIIDHYNYRHKVKPGITGLSQAMGYVGETRNIQAMKDRVQLDIFYVRHWSFWFDIKILWHTLRTMAGF